jgi:hypothetical protein
MTPTLPHMHSLPPPTSSLPWPLLARSPSTPSQTLHSSDGKPFKFSNPTSNELPPHGYDPSQDTFQRSPGDRVSVVVAVDPKSDCLQLLQLFKPWDGKTPTSLPMLIKIKGQCSESCFLFPLFVIDVVADPYYTSYGSHQRWWTLAKVPWTSQEYLLCVVSFSTLEDGGDKWWAETSGRG